MDDGGLTDFADEDVALTEVAQVQIAHSALLTQQASQQWLVHFADYEITPLFPQLDRPLLEVSSEMTQATKIEDRLGWIMDFYTMQGKTTKLGYANGQPEDAGFYYTWEKEFPSSGLKAIIEFSGACAGAREDNEKAAVKELYLVAKAGRRQLKLTDVPAVLLSECWSDYRAIADSGEYNADWEKQVSW